MDVILKFCSTILVFMIVSVWKCKASYCSYYSSYYYSYYYYCPSFYYYYYNYDESITISGGAIAGIVIGCLFAIGFGIVVLVVCCGALGVACCNKQRSTVTTVPTTSVITTQHYSQPQPYGYGPQPMAPPPYGYPNAYSQLPPMTNPPPPDNQSNPSFPPLPPQNAPQGYSSNPFAISSDVNTKYT